MYAIVDIETTGGNAYTDKITEIAIYVHNGERIIDEYCTLINPERSIPPFVQNLTGITDAMVQAAPLFSDVAEEIRRRTEPYIFVAHSSQFDYSFIRQEFKSIGYDFKRPSLCTVSFSRKIMPGHRSYGLSALCERLSIENHKRHRAAGDAMATVRVFEQLMVNGGRDLITELILEHKEEYKLPDCIRPEIMGALPSTPGIFYLVNNNEEIIYIGKGLNIRKAVLTLLTKNKNKKSMRLRESIHDIRFEKTGNDTMAGILEFQEWKKHKPCFNRTTWKPFHAKLRSGFENGYAIFKGRSGEEKTMFHLTQGKVRGFAFFSEHCQEEPAAIINTLPEDPYISFLVHKAILKKHHIRLVPQG